jgi:hypothetical protein
MVSEWIFGTIAAIKAFAAIEEYRSKLQQLWPVFGQICEPKTSEIRSRSTNHSATAFSFRVRLDHSIAR